MAINNVIPSMTTTNPPNDIISSTDKTFAQNQTITNTKKTVHTSYNRIEYGFVLFYDWWVCFDTILSLTKLITSLILQTQRPLAPCNTNHARAYHF